MRKMFFAIMTTILMLASALAIVPTALCAPTGPRVSSRVAESEPNDNFTKAQVLTIGDTVTGTTGMLEANPIDVFKINCHTTKILGASIHTNSAGYNDLVVHLDVYDRWMDKPTAWSHSGFPYESITQLVKYDDFYYLMIIPWKGAHITYTLTTQEITPAPVSDGSFVSDAVSNSTNNPADWYTQTLTGGQTSNQVGNATLSFNPDNVQFDLYLRDLMANSWTWWYNFSWWGYVYGGAGGKVEEAEGAASYTGTYYWDVQAWNGTGPYTLSVKTKSAPSDGDNTPATATLVARKPGETQSKFTGSIDMAYDHFDFYKIHLKKGQTITATVFMQNPWDQAIYRCTIMYYNSSGTRWDAWSSWTNIKDPNIVTGQAQAFLNPAPQDDDYYIQVMSQVPLHPSNHSNLADWHINTAVAKYQLVVDLPMDELHSPTIKAGAPTAIDVTEDTPNSDLKMSSVFTDQDIGDPQLQDALKYSTSGTYDHLKINISNDADGTVTITPEKDWNGQQDVTFVATDLYGLQNHTTITVNVIKVNDPPRLGGGIAELLHDFTVKEGTVNQSNNNAVLVDKNSDPWTYKGFTDPDLTYGDQLTFTVMGNSTANAYVPTEIAEQNNYITVKYQGAKVFNPTGDTSKYVVPITIKATDTQMESISYTYNVTIEQNPPEITCADTVIDVNEGNSTTANLADICKASTGHKLTFEFLGGNSQNLTVKVDAQGNAKFTALGDYYNMNGENLNFKAGMITPWQKTVYFSVNVVIHNINDAPSIYNPQPDPAIAINIPEGSNKDFSASVKDVDNSPLDMRYTWYVDNVAVASGTNNFRYQPDYDAASVNDGKHTIKMVVRDGAGGEAAFNWSVNVDNTNRKPTARITTPLNNTQFDANGKAINFIIEATDPDGDPITIKWMENGQEIHAFQSQNGTALDSWSKKFNAGTTHVIEVVVKDNGGMESRYYLTIVIKPKAKTSGFIPGFQPFLVVLALVGVAAILVRRRKLE